MQKTAQETRRHFIPERRVRWSIRIRVPEEPRHPRSNGEMADWATRGALKY